MNKTVKVICNSATAEIIMISDNAKPYGKKSARVKLLLSALLGMSGLVTTSSVLANAGNDTGAGITEPDWPAGSGWVAIGEGATASGYTNPDGSGTAVGYQSTASGLWSTTLGSYGQAEGDASTALGTKADAVGERSIALGASSKAGGVYSTSVGTLSQTAGTHASALGNSANAAGDYSLALGTAANSGAANSTAIGSNANASGANSVALGASSTATEDNTVSVGNSTQQRKIVYLANGAVNATSTDAINGSQLYGVSNSVATHLGGGAAVNTDGTVSAPTYNVASGTYHDVGSALGALNTSNEENASNIQSLHDDALLWNDSDNAFSASHGDDASNKITNVAAGALAADSTDAVNGSQLYVTNQNVAQNTQDISNLNTQVSGLDTRVTNLEGSVGDIVASGNTKYFKTNSTGPDANAQGQESIAAGSNAQAVGTGSIAVGSSSQATADNSVALGANSVADEADTVSVGSITQQRRITNVATGKNANDAVNVAQLKSAEKGNVRYSTNADGSTNYGLVELGDGNGGTTRIGNLSAGVNDNDAVNYAQLKQSVQDANNYTDQRVDALNGKVNRVQRKLSGGIASAMAMTGLPQAYAPGASMASLGGGTYGGETAVALGVSMVSDSGRWVYKLQGSANSQGNYSAAIGAGIQW